jgi:hypothetical protein
MMLSKASSPFLLVLAVAFLFQVQSGAAMKNGMKIISTTDVRVQSIIRQNWNFVV